jgi:hypothetical protein
MKITSRSHHSAVVNSAGSLDSTAVKTTGCQLRIQRTSVLEQCHFDVVPVPVKVPTSYFFYTVPASVPYITLRKF